MHFQQIDDLTFDIHFYCISDMARYVEEGIHFFNNIFGQQVREVKCDWNTHEITFKLRENSYSQSNINRRTDGTKNSVEWKAREYKIIWKKIVTGESYHYTESEEELRKEYKNHSAVMCNVNKGNYVIDQIVAI